MKLTSSIVAIATLTSMSFAGGDIIPPVFEQEVVQVPVEPVYIAPPAPVEEVYIAPPAPIEEPIYVAPAEPVYVAPVATPAPIVVVPTPAPTPAPAPTPVPVVVAPVVAEALGLYIAGGITGIAVRDENEDSANLFSEEYRQDRQLGFTGRLGYDFMDYLGAELRGTYGMTKEDTSTKFKQIGAYLKPNYNITDELNLYGLLGAAQANMDDWSNLGKTETGFSYGAGVDYSLSNKVSVFTDVLNYLTEDDSNSQWGLTVGAAYQF